MARAIDCPTHYRKGIKWVANLCIFNCISLHFSIAKYILNETFPIFSAKYSNNDVLFLLDTGSNLSYIVNENLVFKNKKISFSISIGINGIHFSKVCKVNPIPIIDRNGKYYKTPRLLYEKYSQKYDFLLGCNSFKNKIVYFFNSNNLVLVEDKNI